MKVLMLRTNKVDPDPRVEKEVNSLLINPNVSIEVLAWDRTENYAYRREKLRLKNGEVTIHRIGISAGWGVGIKKNAMAYIKYTFKTCKWLIKNRKEYDCIHACDLHTVIPSLLSIIIYRKKLVYDIFDYFSDTAHGNAILLKVARFFETRVINNATATIICSEKRMEQIKPAKPKKLCIIHNSPALESFNNQQEMICKSDAPKTKVVYVGNLVEDRCIKEIINTAAELNDVEFHIGGLGKLEGIVEEAAITYDNLFYYGKLKYSDVLSLEMQCDIMIALYDQRVLNHKYAAPNKFYEALALGKPLIMLHETGVDDVIDKYDLGVTVEQNVESIKNGIIKLVNNKSKWLEIAEKGKTIFEKEYSWNIMEKRLNDLYDSII